MCDAVRRAHTKNHFVSRKQNGFTLDSLSHMNEFWSF